MAWDRSPESVLSAHTAWRLAGVPVISVVAGEDRLASRLLVEDWLKGIRKTSVLAPSRRVVDARAAYNAQTGGVLGKPDVLRASVRSLPAMHFLDNLELVLPAALSFATDAPAVDVIVSSTAQEVVRVLEAERTPPSVVLTVLTGLVTPPGVPCLVEPVIKARGLPRIWAEPAGAVLQSVMEQDDTLKDWFDADAEVFGSDGERHQVDFVSRDLRLVLALHRPMGAEAITLQRAGYTVLEVDPAQVVVWPQGSAAEIRAVVLERAERGGVA